MNFKLPAIAAALLCLTGCISESNHLGGNLIPANHKYKVCSPDPVDIPVMMLKADSLSAYSSNRITIGAIRNDDELGLSTRAACITLVPMYGPDDFDLGTGPEFREFHFSSAPDSTSVSDEDQSNILQSVFVYELSEQLDTDGKTYCNTRPLHGDKIISTRIPLIDGTDSLSFNFTKEFSEKYLQMSADDLRDIDTYTKKFPGIYIETEVPAGRGGRFNIFNLQLGYNSDYGYLTGNYAELKIKSTWNIDGKDVRKDSTFYFYFSPSGFYDIDSLLTKSGSGNFPQYCVNLTGQQSSSLQGDAGEEILVEGGGGIKPCVSGQYLRSKAREIISANGDDPSKAVINKATLTFHYKAPDPAFETMYKMPQILSPTCRLISGEDVAFVGLADSSDSNADQGDIHRSTMTYSPDITYHLQSILNLDEDNESLQDGSYDVWLLLMHYDVVTTTTSGNSELSDYYNYLAYQSYMSNMYGGYGGYYGNSYSNYYNYSLMAEYYGSSSTSSSTSSALDRDRYYFARLYGPDAPQTELRPEFSFTYSVPND